MSLLGPESLRGVSLAVSVSGSADLGRLGLLEEHFRLALGEIARAVLAAGGELYYGGYVDSDGYGAFLANELQRLARRDRPFHAVLALSEHRRMPIAHLHAFQESLGLYGDLTCLDVDGNVVVDFAVDRPGEAAPLQDPQLVAAGLTAMRRYMAARTHGRVLIGGRRQGYQGTLPGVLEELLLTAESGQPAYLAGGYGGATADIAIEMVLNTQRWFESAESLDDRYREAIGRVADLSKDQRAALLENGLDADEQMRLAVSHRASEIAALVALGLGRQFAGR